MVVESRKKREIWHPPQYAKADIYAVQALENGIANAEQQKRALDWIITTASSTYDEPFRPDQGDVTNYMLGRRSVGLAIVKLLKLKAEIFND
jgi:hypothetical protein